MSPTCHNSHEAKLWSLESVKGFIIMSCSTLELVAIGQHSARVDNPHSVAVRLASIPISAENSSTDALRDSFQTAVCVAIRVHFARACSV